MGSLSDAFARVSRLETQLEAVRQEVSQLREDLALLRHKNGSSNASVTSPADRGVDCLTVAVSLARDLGSGFSSEHPHDLGGRGEDWFAEP